MGKRGDDLTVKAAVTGEGQFVAITMSRDFARRFLDSLRTAGRTREVLALGEALVAELLALKVLPKRDYRQVIETKRTPYAGDGGDFGPTHF